MSQQKPTSTSRVRACPKGCKCKKHNRSDANGRAIVKQTRTQVRQAQFIEALIASGGIHQPAIDAVGINRSTLYDWREKYPEFVEQMDNVKAMQIDFVRTKLMKGITNGSERLIQFYLERFDPEFARPIDPQPSDDGDEITPPTVVFIPATPQRPDAE